MNNQIVPTIINPCVACTDATGGVPAVLRAGEERKLCQSWQQDTQTVLIQGMNALGTANYEMFDESFSDFI